MHQFDPGEIELEIAGRRPAGNEIDGEALTGKVARDEGRAAQMADAEQMLNIEEHPGAHRAPSLVPWHSGDGVKGRLRRLRQIRPSPATAKRCSPNSFNRC